MYRKPNAFVTITVAEPSVAAITPSFYPVAVAPHFFVAYKDEVVDPGKTYYEGLPLNNIAYPNLPMQTVDPDEYLLVDVGDLAVGGNDAFGDPNIERFDPDVFIVTDEGVEVDISLAEGLLVENDSFSVPGNLIYDPDTGLYVSTKGDIVDGNMGAENTVAWTKISSGNDPVLVKDETSKDWQNDYALKVTLHATPSVGDGVKSTAFTVSGGEPYTAVIRAKKDSVAGVNYDVQVYDEGADTLIEGAIVANKSNTNYETIEISFIVPNECSSITIQVVAAADTGSAIFYVGSMHIKYTGDDLLTGSILTSYRALEEKYTGSSIQRLEASSLEDLQNIFGTAGLSQANPLGYMMLQMYLHANITVRGVAVGNPANPDGSSSYTGSITDEVLSYTASKDFVNLSPDDYYALVPATENEAVWDIFKAYMTSLASEKKYKMRTVVGGGISTKTTFLQGSDGYFHGMFSSAGVGGFVNGDAITYNGTVYTIRVIDGVAYVPLPLTEDTNDITFTYKTVEYTDGAFVIKDAIGVKMALTAVSVTNFLASGYKKVKANDTLMVSGIMYKVLIVRSDILIVEYDDTAGEAAAGLNKVFSVFRYITLDGTEDGVPDKTTMAEIARDRAKSYGSEYFIICLPGWISANINNEWTDIESQYAAAQLAAEMSLPASPLTNMGAGFPVGLGFTGLREAKTHDFHSVRYFSEEQLDIIASGGNLILVNDNPNESLYARHSLTTDMSSIEYQEIMMGVARDYIATTFRRTMLPLIKRNRVAAQLNTAISLRLEAIKTTLVVTEKVAQNIIITGITQGDTPDSVNITGNIYQYYPLNNIYIDLTVVKPVAFTVSV
ncbi:MAG: hypothetical protein WCY30_00070 [Candidatus Neomarinimicrobiota bacterium]|jgi:hypothetical protein